MSCGLDDLLAELEKKRSDSSEKPASNEPPPEAEAAAAPTTGENDLDAPAAAASAAQEGLDGWEEGGGRMNVHDVDEARIQHFEKEIKTYIHDLADPEILREIDGRLRARTYQSLGDYYLTRPSLAQYTIDSEVPRMPYKVTYESAVLATTPEKVRQVFEEYHDALVWRFANQSIFADTLQELRMRFIRTDLDVGVISRDCRFEVDLASDAMVATSVFHVVIAGAGHKSAVELATVLGTVSLCIADETLVQSVELKGLKVVFDDVIRESAEALALNEHLHRGEEPEPLTRAPLGLIRDEFLAVTQAGAGLIQKGVTKLGAIIEAKAREDDEWDDWGDDGEGASSGEPLQIPLKAVAAQGEQVLEGLVGGLGALVGVDGGASPLKGGGQGAEGGGLRLYRREESPTPEPPAAPEATTAGRTGPLGGGLWSMLRGNGEGWVDSAPAERNGDATAAVGDNERRDLPPPPSAMLKGLFSGLGGIVAQSIEAVKADGQEGSLRLYRREEGAEAAGGLKLYRRDPEPPQAAATEPSQPAQEAEMDGEDSSAEPGT